jgi:hypothetical protein
MTPKRRNNHCNRTDRSRWKQRVPLLLGLTCARTLILTPVSMRAYQAPASGELSRNSKKVGISLIGTDDFRDLKAYQLYGSGFRCERQSE